MVKDTRVMYSVQKQDAVDVQALRVRTDVNGDVCVIWILQNSNFIFIVVECVALVSYLHLYASVTKQYNLVLAKRQ